MNREALIYYAVKYKGEYSKIRKAIAMEEAYNAVSCSCGICTILDPEYPLNFKDLQDPPFVLFYMGTLEILNLDKFGVIGSRNASDYGKYYTEWIISQLNHVAIVSGLAKGIDGISHEAAIRNQLKTIGILGNGLDVFYPVENENLQRYMEKYELVLTEYPFGVKPAKHHFPMRNRLIAALSDKLIITQAALKSGTMITVDAALELNKEIYTIPYALNDEDGSGCNYLIENGALMILNIDDLG